MRATRSARALMPPMLPQSMLRAGGVVLLALSLAACDGPEAGRSSGQVAARVDDQEITVHQINAALARAANRALGSAQQASLAALERLIDQELLIAQAAEQKVDRDPEVMQAIDIARREIVSRAYLERVTSPAARPAAEAVAAFYRDNPHLFAKRRIYALQELSIQAPSERLAEIRAAAERAESIAAIGEWLRRERIAFSPAGGIKPAEDVPVELLQRLAQMRDGDRAVIDTAGGLQVVLLSGSREQPLDEAAARPLIERFLTNQEKIRLAQEELRRLRGQARLEYLGEFASAQQATGLAPAPISSEALQRGADGLK